MAPDRYTAVARWLHWIMAALIIVNLALGLGHEVLPRDWAVMPVHKSIGLTVLALAIVRILWRFTHRTPPFPAHMPGWEKAAATAMHAIFYLFIVIVPLSGWIMTSAGDRPLTWFGLFAVPKFGVAKGDVIVGVAHEGHEVLGLVWLALLVVHIAAALRHHVLLKDNVLRRML